MKEETKKLLMLVGALVLVGVIVLIAIVSQQKKAEKYLEDVNQAFKEKENTLVYLGRDTCSYCTLLTPVLEDYADEYEFDYVYIDTDKANLKMNDILKKFELNEEEFGTPYLAVVKDGQIVKEQNGYVAEDQLFNWLKESGFIPKDAKLDLNYIDYNTYKEKLENGDKTVFTVIQTGCGYCEDAKPVLAEIADEYDFDINVINLSNFENDEQQQEFMNSLSYYNNEQWGTPLILVVEDKNVVDSIQGFTSKEDYISFFKENGFIKE